ncbi:MAG: hypothetical protein C0471_06165 [Erythrobacter sp.]|nr:hypothetical protein [Erythrobacter sp.]
MLPALVPADFIEIDRRFVPFEQLGRPDADELWAEVLASREEKRDWDWLLSHRVVALLAEAGSGKSYEFRAQVDRLARTGRSAFYFRIERMCDGSLESAFETPEQEAAFRIWKARGNDSVFFLDSVDEAKLPKGEKSEPLRDALITLERAIGPRLTGARVVVSCRGSEWYRETEQVHISSFASRIGAASQGIGQNPDDQKLLRNVSFAALDIPRVKLLAAAHGDPDGFLEALDEYQLWDEVRTPMDVVHLATAYFANEDKTGLMSQLCSRSAVLNASVRRRLADRPDSRSRMEMLPIEALGVARFLAFALTAMQLRDISFDTPVPCALDARSLLEHGPISASPLQLRQMLATPLFTPAGRGSVRFYRPEIEAMLAAQYLESLRDHLPTTSITEAFGSQSFGVRFVAHPFGPMLAWLAASDPRILRWLTNTAPEFLIEEGDPRALAVGDRIAALEQHVSQAHRNLPGGFYFPNAAMARFADADLEANVVHLLTNVPVAREAKLHLLQIVRMGKYASAADWLEQVCGDAFTPSDIRAYAVRALIACGTMDHLRRTCETMLAWGTPLYVKGYSDHHSQREDDARIHLIGAAYPHAISLETMLRLLAQVRGREFARDGDVFVALSQRAPLADLPLLIEGLESLCWKTRPSTHFRHKAPEKTSRASLLFDGLCASIARSVVEHPDAVRIESICWCFDASRYSSLDRDKEEWREMSKALRRSATVRQRLIVAAVNSNQASHPFVGLQGMMSGAWRADTEARSVDIAFALREYAHASVELREIWADLLMRWIAPTSRMAHRKVCFQLAHGAFRQSSGIDWPTLKAVRWRPFGWVRRLWFRYTYNDWSHIRFKLRSVLRDFRENLIWGWALVRNWRKLNQGEEWSLTFHFIFGDWDEKLSREELLRRKGSIFGTVLVNAACRWASKISPFIRYRSEIVWLNDTGFRWLHEADPNFARGLTEAVRRAAIQQDLWESDESPDWADAIAATDMVLWSEVAMSEVIAELSRRAKFEPEHSNTPLWKLHKQPVKLQSAVASVLLDWAERNTTMCRIDIRPLADIVQSTPELVVRLQSLARRGTREALYEGQWRRGLAWLEVWARYDVESIECLCDWLENEWRGNKTCEFYALSALGNLLGGRWNRETVTLTPLPSELRLRLANLVHDIVRPAEDEPTREGVQTVTPRRELEDVRRLVDNYLGADHSHAGRQALVRFVESRILPAFPDWAERWLASHARAANQPQGWTINHVSQFARRGSIAPSNGDGLLAHVMAEIAEICGEMNASEFDRRALFDRSTDESDFRAWLGHELDARLRGWASITQETVTRGEKRTDLRIELRGGDYAVLVIEIKLAHRWNRDVLLDKIKSQLVDQYLIGDRRVRHGVYLLVDFGLPLKGSLPDSTKPDLTEFAGQLTVRADELSGEDGRVMKFQQFSILK